jgi:Tol biopolymer transport system component
MQAFSWSPDRQKIAIWLNITPEKRDSNMQLAVLELSTHQVTNYCINGSIAFNLSKESAPIWSPDGKQLLVVSDISNSPLTGDVSDLDVTYTYVDIVVDITNNTAMQIGENFTPDGWMKIP